MADRDLKDKRDPDDAQKWRDVFCVLLFLLRPRFFLSFLSVNLTFLSENNRKNFNRVPPYLKGKNPVLE